jgi:hypothetical protein
MGSYQNIVKIEEMRKKIEEGDQESAIQILDTMDIKKIKNISDLNLIAEVLKDSERYDEAAQFYLKIYEKSGTRRTIGNLVNISIKRGNLKEAQKYLELYQKSASDDFDSFVFRYKIGKMQAASYDELIRILKTLKSMERTEKWEYELAKLYYKAGMVKECIKECSEIILWFGEGTYVEKAKMLRSYYASDESKEQFMEELKRRAEGSGAEYGATEDFEAESSGAENSEAGASRAEYSDADYSGAEYNEAEASGADYNGAEYDEADASEAEYSDSDDNGADRNGAEHIGEYQELVKADQDLEEYQDTYSEEQLSEEEEEDIYSGRDYMEEHDTKELEDGLKNDVRLILTDEAKDESTGDDTSVQNTKIREEDSTEEEDRKLSQISEEFQIDLDEVFGDFLCVTVIKKQLVSCLENLLSDSTQPALMIITGPEGSGKTTLAKSMALFLNITGRIQSSKVAKITAQKLNSLDIKSKREALRSCCIVIENACELKHTTIDGLLELIRYLKGDVAVILEDNKENQNKLITECPSFYDMLKNRIHLPQCPVNPPGGF